MKEGMKLCPTFFCPVCREVFLCLLLLHQRQSKEVRLVYEACTPSRCVVRQETPAKKNQFFDKKVQSCADCLRNLHSVSMCGSTRNTCKWEFVYKNGLVQCRLFKKLALCLDVSFDKKNLQIRICFIIKWSSQVQIVQEV